MDPENTDCHLINSEDKTPEALLQAIRSATFRFKQNLKISRYRYPKTLEFFSCDGKTGYLLAEKTDGNFEIYPGVSKETWDGLLEATDVLEEFNSKFKRDHTPFLNNR